MHEVKDDEYNPLTRLCEELHQHVPGLHLWAASLYHGHRPPLLTEVILTQPLRTPPSVTRHVQHQPFMAQGVTVYDYTAAPSPLPCDGLDPRVVRHTGQGHGEGEPGDCEQCGFLVGQILVELGVGGTGSTPGSPRPLQYRDVFILTNVSFLHDAKSDASGQVTRPASGVLRGVREAGIPVTLLESGDEDGVRDVATMAGPDHVIATRCFDVQGLERKVVVWVGGGDGDDEFGRLLAASRCTSQLVLVTPPRREQSDTSSDDDSDCN
ncbi:uncharacterized protein [Littorina saxatilis]|uniref:uncharacterized protein n=1 Tax=Littorina saxatilis TaxID=31220 RepID=UPI0038B4A3AD